MWGPGVRMTTRGSSTSVGGDTGHLGPERPEVPGQPLHAGVAVQVRQHARQDRPVDQRVPEARRRSRPVAHHHVVARPVPHEVDGRMQEVAAAGDGDTVAGTDERRVALGHLRRDQARGDCAALPVQVGQHQVEEGRPLGDAGLEGGPLDGVEDGGDRVEGPRPAPATGKVVVAGGDGVGRTLVPEQPGQLVAPGQQAVGPEGVEVVGDLAPRAADRPVRIHQLVDACRRRPVAAPDTRAVAGGRLRRRRGRGHDAAGSCHRASDGWK